MHWGKPLQKSIIILWILKNNLFCFHMPTFKWKCQGKFKSINISECLHKLSWKREHTSIKEEFQEGNIVTHTLWIITVKKASPRKMVSWVEKLTGVNRDVSGDKVHVQNYSSLYYLRANCSVKKEESGC